MREHLAPDEGEWLAALALAAARSGAQDDALRLWRARANLDRCALGALGDLAEAGLRPAHVRFYRELGGADPDTEAAAAALALLEAR